MRQDDVLSTERERLKRIGDILCTAILAEGTPVHEPDEAGVGPVEQEHLPLLGRRGMAPEDKVVDYLAKVGEASPAILRAVLQMPRTSAYRVINGLVESGRVMGDGQTRALVYRLGTLPPHQQNVEGN